MFVKIAKGDYQRAAPAGKVSLAPPPEGLDLPGVRVLKVGARRVVDLGCGPGHVTARLAEGGAQVVGFDPSPAMVAAARAAHPGLEVQQASLAQFLRPRTAEAWGVVVAWFSLIHLAASELPDAFATIARTLRVGGWLLVALHARA